MEELPNPYTFVIESNWPYINGEYVGFCSFCNRNKIQWGCSIFSRENDVYTCKKDAAMYPGCGCQSTINSTYRERCESIVRSLNDTLRKTYKHLHNERSNIWNSSEGMIMYREYYDSMEPPTKPALEE